MVMGNLSTFFGVLEGGVAHESWWDRDYVLSELKDESASQIVKARRFDDVVSDVYSTLKE